MSNEEKVEGETLETQETETLTTPEEETSKNSIDVDDLKKKADLAANYKIRAEKAEAERRNLEKRLNQIQKTGDPTKLNVEDYIDISSSLEGLDQREKEYLAKQHTLTGKPLNELRKDEDFALWQSAYREKVEKERKAIPPSGTQSESDKPKTLTEKLATASLEEKEKLLTEAGLWKSPRPRADRVDLGRGLR